jgi:hypothetical protein
MIIFKKKLKTSNFNLSSTGDFNDAKKIVNKITHFKIFRKTFLKTLIYYFIQYL